ncbi:cephalosporin hydroxylase [Rickettsia australis str. Cutlack]|uniref:Cephalosporin hydroxylase n=1 Tax=Rickettsia australis (strain Cutlack) TaxID=1105110 RepID=H8K8M5_RICAC|nr:cephalosporin hydroxylase [Rickettsia australis str. Cutlack]
MRKEIYLKNFNINSDEVLNNFTKNPYKSIVFFKNFLEKICKLYKRN